LESEKDFGTYELEMRDLMS